MNTFAPHPSSPTPTPAPTPKSAPTAPTAPLLERFLAPGLRLMQRLRLPAKLSILSSLMLVPLLGFLATTVLTHNSTLATLERERAGVAVTQGLAELASEVQLNRTQTLQARTDLAAVNAEREHLQRTLAALSQRFEAIDAFALADAWGPVNAASLALSRAPGKDMRALYQQHSQLLKDIQALQDLVAERSELLFDPVASTYFLMVLSTSNLPELSEALGQTFDLASRVLARGEASSRDRWAIAAELERVKHLTQDTEKQIAALARSGLPASPHWSRVRQGAQAFATRTESAFSGDRVPDDVAGYRAAGLELVENTQRLAHESATVLDLHLAHRESDVRQARLLALLTAGLCLVMLSYLVLSFYLSFSRSLSQLQAAAAAMAEGDLSHPVSVHGQDELADMAGTMERTVGMLSVLVADIRTCAVRVDQAGGEIARGGDSLSSRTAQEGLGLGQATSALQQLNSIVTRQHRALDQLHDRTRSLGSQSDACSEVTERSVAAMQQLDDSVRRVGEINAVIDDIAFQTNLLALNASVEAARAGELGKGFGIVATEVRALSQRCSDAAAEIRSLIDQTADQSGLSRHSLTEASQLLGELVSGIAAVSTDLQDMAQIGGDQQGSLDVVSRSVSDLSELTQHNADAVGSTSKASESLSTQARALRKSVAAVQLRQGGADEARAMVERGMKRVLDVGWPTALAEFNQGNGAWTDRDMYLFAFDAAGCYAVHALRPEHIGKTLDGLGLTSEEKAERFLSDGRSAAAQPSGGWIDYEIYTSAGHAVAKSAYVIHAEDGVFLGCGVHRMRTPAFS